MLLQRWNIRNLRVKRGLYCLCFLPQRVMVKCLHMCKGCGWFVWASSECETLLNSRHFGIFATIMLRVGILWLLPHTRVHHKTYFRIHAFSVLRRFTPMHVRVCTCVLTQECNLVFRCWFFFFTRHLRLYFEEFTQTVLWKTWSKKPCFVCVSSLRVDLVVWHNCHFPSVETWLWKPYRSASCKKNKHMAEEFQGNNSASGFWLEAPFEEEEALHHFFKTFKTTNVTRDPFWHNTTQNCLVID